MNDAVWMKLIDQLPAIVTALGVIVTAYLSYKANQNGKAAVEQSKVNEQKITEVHDSVNGKMEKLLEVSNAASRAEGKLEGEGLPQKIPVDDIVKVALVEEIK